MSDTIFALSSGALPAAIGIVRISGPSAFAAGEALSGPLPPARLASLRTVRGTDGAPLDRALVLRFPGPTSTTGEDLLELHLHGGRAVVRAVLAAIGSLPSLRPAEPGEFTRRALANGRIDLSQAEGLADLLAAESEAARRAALAAADGAVSRAVARWTASLVGLSARLEAQIDFADEDDVAADAQSLAAIAREAAALSAELATAAANPPSERLRDGVRVVIAGPPNAGKSSLLNALAEREVAIATPVAGTTRDRIEAPVLRNGIAWLLVDVAGLRDRTDDPVEAIGIERARSAMRDADIVLWLGDDPPAEPAMIAVHARIDVPDRVTIPVGRIGVSAATGAGLGELWRALGERARALLPRPDMVAYNDRQRGCLARAAAALVPVDDPILLAEHFRTARVALDGVTGAADVERMLDDLFGRFCIGK